MTAGNSGSANVRRTLAACNLPCGVLCIIPGHLQL